MGAADPKPLVSSGRSGSSGVARRHQVRRLRTLAGGNASACADVARRTGRGLHGRVSESLPVRTPGLVAGAGVDVWASIRPLVLRGGGERITRIYLMLLRNGRMEWEDQLIARKRRVLSLFQDSRQRTGPTPRSTGIKPGALPTPRAWKPSGLHASGTLISVNVGRFSSNSGAAEGIRRILRRLQRGVNGRNASVSP